jgi:integrase
MRGHKRFKDGSWRLIVDAGKDPMTGKRRQIFRTVRAPNTRAGAQAADVELARLVVEVTSGETAPSAQITVGELLVRWVEHRRRGWEARSPGQPDWTLSVIRKHFIPRVGDVQLGTLRPVDIDHMYSRWRQQGMAESSVRRLHNLLHSALGQAVRWDLIATNPADRIERPQPAKSKRKAPSDGVLRALLDAADDDYACYLRLAAVTGARRGQLVALRWSDLDLTAGSVLFTRAHARVRGGVAEKTTKADVDYGIALDPETVEALGAHRKRCAERALATGASLPPTAYVFARPTAPDGSVAWTPPAASSAFARLRTKVPGAEGVRAHDLRHWLATSMFPDGFDPVTVAGGGGWSSPTVPMKVYGHFAPARDQAAAASLAQRLAVAERTAGVDDRPPSAPARG